LFTSFISEELFFQKLYFKSYIGTPVCGWSVKCSSTTGRKCIDEGFAKTIPQIFLQIQMSCTYLTYKFSSTVSTDDVGLHMKISKAFPKFSNYGKMPAVF